MERRVMAAVRSLQDQSWWVILSIKLYLKRDVIAMDKYSEVIEGNCFGIPTPANKVLGNSK